MDTSTDPGHPDCQYRIDDPRTPERKTYVDEQAWVEAHPEEARKKWLWLTAGHER